MFYRKAISYPSVKVILCIMFSLIVSTIFAGHCFAADQSSFTGLVIDARGIGLKSSMSPKVVDLNGKEIYGTFLDADQSYLLDFGVVSYAKDFSDKSVVERVGVNPIIIKAIGKNGVFNADPIVADDDVEKIMLADKESEFLKKYAVVFIID